MILQKLSEDAEYIWERMKNLKDREAPMTHDGYLKLYQLRFFFSYFRSSFANFWCNIDRKRISTHLNKYLKDSISKIKGSFNLDNKSIYALPYCLLILQKTEVVQLRHDFGGWSPRFNSWYAISFFCDNVKNLAIAYTF